MTSIVVLRGPLPRVKSVISIMIMHICLASTMMSLPVSSHFATSRSNLFFSVRNVSTWAAIFCFSSSDTNRYASLVLLIPLMSGYSS
uniref:Putative secreted protein n=1 Tax=Ixodes ricinus TaxID=34613 RepID=A0A6B0TZ47_IXORI